MYSVEIYNAFKIKIDFKIEFKTWIKMVSFCFIMQWKIKKFISLTNPNQIYHY